MSGLLAYRTNSHDTPYLIWVPPVVIIILVTCLGIISTRLTKRYQIAVNASNTTVIASQKQVPPPSQDSKYGIGKVFIISGLILFGSIAFLATIRFIEVKVGTNSLRNEFVAKIKECEKKPVVAVSGTDLYGMGYIDVYTPDNAQYQYVKYTNDYFGGAKVKIYYCTLNDAKTALANYPGNVDYHTSLIPSVE